MKFQTCLIVAACCCLLAAMGGLLPVESQTMASPTIEGTPMYLAQAEAPEPAEPEPAEAVDDHVPAEEPEPEAPDTKSAANASCPASAASSSGHASHGHRDFVLFDGDGYLVDRRAEAAAACGDGEGWFPRLRARRQAAAAGECVVGQPIRNFFRRRN